MITPRSALKFDLFAEASRQHKRDGVGDPLQVIARHIDFGALAGLVDALIERGDGRRGGRPAYPTEVMVRILVLKRLYNLSDEQMEYQLLDRASYQRFCLLQDAMHVPDRNTIWRFGERLGVDGATALLQGVDAQLPEPPKAPDAESAGIRGCDAAQGPSGQAAERAPEAAQPAHRKTAGQGGARVRRHPPPGRQVRAHDRAGARHGGDDDDGRLLQLEAPGLVP